MRGGAKRKKTDGDDTAKTYGSIAEFHGEFPSKADDSDSIKAMIAKKDYDVHEFLSALDIKTLDNMKLEIVKYSTNGVNDAFIKAVAQYIPEIVVAKDYNHSF